MDFLNRCLRSRNFFLSAGLPDFRCFWKALSLCLAIRFSFWLTQGRLFLVLESFKGMDLFVREVSVEWRSSHSCTALREEYFHFQACPDGRLLVPASSHPSNTGIYSKYTDPYAINCFVATLLNECTNTSTQRKGIPNLNKWRLD